MLAFKLCPSLSPRAPEFHRISIPICSQRRSRRSSVDTVATDASGITIDSVSTLVAPDIKRKRRLSAGASTPIVGDADIDFYYSVYRHAIRKARKDDEKGDTSHGAQNVG